MSLQLEEAGLEAGMIRETDLCCSMNLHHTEATITEDRVEATWGTT